MSNTIIVEITGNHRSGTAAKSGKPYCMYEGYVHLPNVPYPQRADFYAETPNQVPRAGKYECDVIAQVRDSRLSFEVDPRQGRVVSTAAKVPA
ncbi:MULTISPECIES: propanediol utilization protein [Pseudomonas]|uniref:propanediol utilization protein n=1 Tax=Pseudomonas TaxID=286 RepID=UPI00138811A6|nr:propanediol utilization protein [Pseudomonas sp. NY11382]EBV3304084.1 propanediol utilization protein [Salmonella enterica subsp. enterica serovar Enteritidis]ELF6204230.1 propanediol utilization protein [Pseudomonas putida]WBM35257.1 propanediol utilization protein [Pseudomonas sp. NY11382]